MKVSELDSELIKLNHEFAVLKLEVSGRKNKNHALISKRKKDLSRLLTIKNEIKDK